MAIMLILQHSLKLTFVRIKSNKLLRPNSHVLTTAVGHRLKLKGWGGGQQSWYTTAYRNCPDITQLRETLIYPKYNYVSRHAVARDAWSSAPRSFIQTIITIQLLNIVGVYRPLAKKRPDYETSTKAKFQSRETCNAATFAEGDLNVPTWTKGEYK